MQRQAQAPQASDATMRAGPAPANAALFYYQQSKFVGDVGGHGKNAAVTMLP
jgi:hypothetical protein